MNQIKLTQLLYATLMGTKPQDMHLSKYCTIVPMFGTIINFLTLILKYYLFSKIVARMFLNSNFVTSMALLRHCG